MQAPVAHAIARMDCLRRVCGQNDFTAAQVAEFIREALRTQSHLGFRHGRGHLAMTIQRAKNREFQNVIVLWPHTDLTPSLLGVKYFERRYCKLGHAVQIRTRSLATVSRNPEFSNCAPETIGYFSLRKPKIGTWRLAANLRKPAIGGALRWGWRRFLSAPHCLA